MQRRQCPAELSRTEEGVSREVGLKEIKVPLVYLSLHQRESKSVKGFNIEPYMLKVIQSAKNRVYLYVLLPSFKNIIKVQVELIC